MSTRAHVCAVAAACLWVVPTGAGAQERTADAVVEAIVREGPRAAAIRSGVEVVRREQQARLALPNPEIAYSREGAGFTEFMQVDQPLPARGVRDALHRAGVAATAAAEAERDARLWDLRSEASFLTLRWLWAQARRDAAAADVTAVERLVDVLRTREREGEGSRFDRLRGEQEVAELKQASVAAAVELADARGRVLAMLPPGFGVTTLAVVGPASGAAPDVDALMARARTSRAELKALQQNVDHAGLEAEAARRARWFVPSVSGGFKRADNGASRDHGAVLGVRVAVPLFDTGARDVARWTAEGARLAAERTAIEQQVRGEIARAAEVLVLRRQAVTDAGGDGAAELVATADVAYREGEMGIGVLLDALRTASRARQRELDRRFDLRLAQAALERAVGERVQP